MAKKVILVLASLFLMVQSYKFIGSLKPSEIQSFGLLIFLSWLLNMFITGIFAFAGFALPTQKLMPKNYYKIKNPELLHKVYSILKVDLFRFFLLATFWKNKKQRKKYFNGTKSGLVQFIEESQKAEFGHLLPFIILSALSSYYLFQGAYIFAISITMFNILGNAYPILLQRFHRIRIDRLYQKYQSHL